MKLSKRTVEILNNFNAINPNIVIQPGSEIKTVAEAKNILAQATIDDEFESEVGIYNLSEFLGVRSMFEDPDLTVNSDHIRFKENGRSVKYYLSDPEMLTTPSKIPALPGVDVQFDLSAEDLSAIRKAATTLDLPDLVITNDNGQLKALVTDISNDTSNEFAIDLSGENDQSFSLVFRVASLKIIVADYKIEISKRLISKFMSPDVNYLIALEESSKFGA